MAKSLKKGHKTQSSKSKTNQTQEVAHHTTKSQVEPSQVDLQEETSPAQLSEKQSKPQEQSPEQNTVESVQESLSSKQAPSLSALVIGMGLFGSAVARKLTSEGWFVLAVDEDQSKLNQIANEVSSVRVINAVDLKVIESLEPHTFDICISAIGDENAHVISTTIHNLKQCNASFIMARILNEQHEEIFRKLGCDLVVKPEESFGEQLSILLHNHLISGQKPKNLTKEYRLTAEQLKEAQFSVGKIQKEDSNLEVKPDLTFYLLVVFELLIWGFLIKNIYQIQTKLDLVNKQLSNQASSEGFDSQMQVIFILIVLWLGFKGMRHLLIMQKKSK